MSRQSQQVVIRTNANDGAVALAIEPHVEGIVGVAQVVKCFRLYAISIELDGYVRIDVLTEDNIVHTTHDRDVSHLAQGVAIELLIEAQVHIVSVQVVKLAILGTYHTEYLRTVRILRDLDDVALIRNILRTILAESLCL